MLLKFMVVLVPAGSEPWGANFWHETRNPWVGPIDGVVDAMEARRPGHADFEHLLLLRQCYPMRGDYDSRGVLSVAAAIDYGEWRMRLARVSELRRGGWPTESAA
jgi:hypothetical protein